MISLDFYLKLVQVIVELLKAFLERDEAGRDFRSRCASRLHHLFLIEQGLQP